MALGFAFALGSIGLAGLASLAVMPAACAGTGTGTALVPVHVGVAAFLAGSSKEGGIQPGTHRRPLAVSSATRALAWSSALSCGSLACQQSTSSAPASLGRKVLMPASVSANSLELSACCASIANEHCSASESRRAFFSNGSTV